MSIFRFVLVFLLFATLGLRIWTWLYMEKWQRARARTWPVTEGSLDEGGVRTVKKENSGKVIGYEALFSYDYKQTGGYEGIGVYAFVCDTHQEAENVVKLLAHKKVPVHVSPRKPGKSFVLDEDLSAILPPTRSSR